MIIIGRANIESLITSFHDLLPQKDVGEYIKKLVSDTNIDTLYNLLKKVYNIEKTYDNIPQPRLDIVLYLLCTEAISISEIDTFLGMDEYSLYYILGVELNRLKGFNLTRKKKVIDYIPQLAYGSIDMRSYKDIENIVNELVYIIDNAKDITFSDICSYTDKRDIVIYLINNFIKINGDFINLSYSNGEYTISSNITNPDVWSLLPKISFYLNNNIEIPESILVSNLDVDINNPDLNLNQDNFNFNNIKSRYEENKKAKQIAKLLPIILERTINYNEI